MDFRKSPTGEADEGVCEKALFITMRPNKKSTTTGIITGWELASVIFSFTLPNL
jgi:hypothetical protein